MSLPEFQRYQRDFTRHVRDPRAHPRPEGVPARRMRVYNELLFNNLKGFLDACFPVSQALLGEDRWRRLARAFFAEHRPAAPLFRQIPEEFVRWLGTGSPRGRVPDYLKHLAHYEWVELALDVMDREPGIAGVDPDGDLLSGRPVLNPVSFLLAYPYAVHRIGPLYRPRPAQREATHILAFRNTQDAVRFVVLNGVSARLVALLQPGRLSGRAALRRVAAELQHPQPEVVLAGGLEILDNLRSEGALLGARPSRRTRAGRAEGKTTRAAPGTSQTRKRRRAAQPTPGD